MRGPNEGTTPYEREADEVAAYGRRIEAALAKLKDPLAVAGHQNEYEAIAGGEDEAARLDALLAAIEDDLAEQDAAAPPAPAKRYVQEPPYQATRLVVNRFVLRLGEVEGKLVWQVKDATTGRLEYASPWERDAVYYAVAYSQGLDPADASRLHHDLNNPGVGRYVEVVA